MATKTTRRHATKPTNKELEKITLGRQIERYLRCIRVAKQQTVLSYQTQYKIISNEKIMKKKVADLTSQMLMDWYEHMSVVEGYSFSTINVWHSGLIKPALAMASLSSVIGRNPADFQLTSIVPKRVNKGRELTDEEVQALLDYLNNSNDSAAKHNKGFIKLLLSTGMRVSEMCGVTVDDIDFKKRELHINKQLYRKYGYYTLDTVKSGSGNRVIPLTDMAIEALHDILDENGPCQATIQGYTGFILTNRNHMPSERNSLYSKYKNLCVTVDKLYGTDLSSSSLHSLRHTYCSRLIRAGVSVKTVQYVMGHANAATTLDIYTHVMQQSVNSEVLNALHY